jgi:glutamate dehydrogenase (NADP+)
MGGGKGGSDFDPKGKSDNEVMRFCQSFMAELFRHIGPDTDVPAGDIGVGAREIGFLFGMYKKLRNEFTGVLTGKSLNWGGSLIRPEATGYGSVYFASEMLATRRRDPQGKICLVSGSGNVAQYTTEKIIDLGGQGGDPFGFFRLHYDEEGIDRDKLAFLSNLKNVKRGRIKEYAEKYPTAVYTTWTIPPRTTTPCGTTRPTAPSPRPPRTRSTPRTPRIWSTTVSNWFARGPTCPPPPKALTCFWNKLLYGPGQGGQCRRRIGVGPGDDPEQHAPVLDA